MKPRVSSISIADFGCVELSLPILSFGEEAGPTLSIVSGIHGDETAGLFVAEQLVRSVPKFKGHLQVLPSAHPLSQALEMRLTPKEHKDLNRVFPGDPKKELPDRIANAILEQLLSSDMVIDLHSFALKNPTMAIHMRCGEDSVRSRSLEAVEAFAPDMVWVLEVESDDEVEYHGALGPTLAMRGVPNFAVELPSNHRLTAEDIEKACAGIGRVMTLMGMTEGELELSRELPFFRREEHYAPCSGLLYPACDIATKVFEGDLIATIRRLPDFTEVEVTAPFDGDLIQLHDRGLVTTGMAIYAMGHRVEV